MEWVGWTQGVKNRESERDNGICNTIIRPKFAEG